MKRKPSGSKYRNLIARGGAIYYRRRVAGKHIRFSCETSDWDAAAKVRDLYEARKHIGLPVAIIETPKFAEMADRYLKEATAHLAATTLQDRKGLLEESGQLRDYFGTTRIDEIRRPTLLEWWHVEVEAKGRSPKTGRNRLDALSAVLGYAVDLELMEVNPVDVFRSTLRRRNRSKRGRVEAEAGRTITPVEPVAALHRLVDAAPKLSPKAGVFVLLCLDAGLRHGEAAGLRWGRIAWGIDAGDTDRHLIIDGNRPRGGALDHTKSGRARRVALSRRLRTALLELYMAEGQPDADAFVLPGHDPSNFMKRDPKNPKKDREWARILKRAKVAGFKPKDLRDSFASYLLTAGVQLGYVSRQLGHSNVATTAAHYARWAGGDAYRSPLELEDGEVPADLLARLSGPNVVTGTDLALERNREISSNFNILSGGPPGTRTQDHRVKSPVLYQLS